MKWKGRSRVWAGIGIAFMVILINACGSGSTAQNLTPQPPTVTPKPAVTARPTGTPMPEPPPIPLDLSDVGVITPTLPINQITVFGYTHVKPNGNRLAQGAGFMTSAQPIDILLDGTPAWVVGAPLDNGASIWAVVLTDGAVQSFLINAGSITPVHLQPDRLPPGMPPLLTIRRGVPQLLTSGDPDASPFTHPVLLDTQPAQLAYITTNGDLVVRGPNGSARLAVNALPDARILQDDRGRILLVTGPTDRYAHNVLGDNLEGSSLTILSTDPVQIQQVISTGDRVIEGGTPLWLDLDDDGDWEIIVTLSDDASGSQIVAFHEDGSLVAAGPAIGRGYRWRHQLVAAPFSENGQLFLVDNLTPHLGGVTEFYNLDGSSLTVLSAIRGFSTHRLGSRNLDMALAGDLDSDGFVEVLLPTQDGQGLGAIRAPNGIASVAWTIDLGAALTTNIAGVTMLDGSLAVGVGLGSQTLRLWLP